MSIKIIYPKHEQSGFTLIEVLVTLLIIAVGLLSIAALQFKGLQYNQDAYFRSQINFLAYDIADRMRLNRANAANYIANYTVPAAAPAGCNEAQGADAANDLLCWHTQVYYALPPTSEANITAAGNMYTVTLLWNDREGTARSIAYTFQL